MPLFDRGKSIKSERYSDSEEEIEADEESLFLDGAFEVEYSFDNFETIEIETNFERLYPGLKASTPVTDHGSSEVDQQEIPIPKLREHGSPVVQQRKHCESDNEIVPCRSTSKAVFENEQSSCCESQLKDSEKCLNAVKNSETSQVLNVVRVQGNGLGSATFAEFASQTENLEQKVDASCQTYILETSFNDVACQTENFDQVDAVLQDSKHETKPKVGEETAVESARKTADKLEQVETDTLRTHQETEIFKDSLSKVTQSNDKSSPIHNLTKNSPNVVTPETTSQDASPKAVKKIVQEAVQDAKVDKRNGSPKDRVKKKNRPRKEKKEEKKVSNNVQDLPSRKSQITLGGQEQDKKADRAEEEWKGRRRKTDTSRDRFDVESQRKPPFKKDPVQHGFSPSAWNRYGWRGEFREKQVKYHPIKMHEMDRDGVRRSRSRERLIITRRFRDRQPVLRRSWSREGQLEHQRSRSRRSRSRDTRYDLRRSTSRDRESDFRRSRSRTPAFRRSRSRTPAFRRSRSRTPAFRRSRSRTPAFRRSRSRTPAFLRSWSRTPQLRRSRSRTSDLRRNRSRTPDLRRSRSKTPDLRRSWSKTPDLRRSRSKTPDLRRSRSKTPDLRRTRSKTPDLRRSRSNTPDLRRIRSTDRQRGVRRSPLMERFEKLYPVNKLRDEKLLGIVRKSLSFLSQSRDQREENFNVEQVIWTRRNGSHELPPGRIQVAIEESHEVPQGKTQNNKLISDTDTQEVEQSSEKKSETPSVESGPFDRINNAEDLHNKSWVVSSEWIPDEDPDKCCPVVRKEKLFETTDLRSTSSNETRGTALDAGSISAPDPVPEGPRLSLVNSDAVLEGIRQSLCGIVSDTVPVPVFEPTAITELVAVPELLLEAFPVASSEKTRISGDAVPVLEPRLVPETATPVVKMPVDPTSGGRIEVLGSSTTPTRGVPFESLREEGINGDCKTNFTVPYSEDESVPSTDTFTIGSVDHLNNSEIVPRVPVLPHYWCNVCMRSFQHESNLRSHICYDIRFFHHFAANLTYLT